GRLAPARVECHSTSGGKPPFPTCETLLLVRFLQSALELTAQMLQAVFLISILLAVFVNASASSTFEEYEGRQISSIEVGFEGSPPDPSAEAEFLSIIRIVPNTEFSAASIRNALQELFNSERVANARVEVVETAGQNARGPIRLR